MTWDEAPEDHDEASLNVPNIDLVPGCLACSSVVNRS
jgi:hypothetical protein